MNKYSQLNISITIEVDPENSSDLSSGRRPLSKSDEFSGSTSIVIEILTCAFFYFLIHATSFWELYPEDTAVEDAIVEKGNAVEASISPAPLARLIESDGSDALASVCEPVPAVWAVAHAAQLEDSICSVQ